ncbi:MAG: VOC family protein, partial [Dehalococcoidia bacterium]
MVDPIPQDYPRLLSYITPRDASEAIRFYTDVFGATERMRMDGPDGRIGHAELQFGDSVLMLSEEPGDVMTGYQAPSTLGGTT